jgi:uncharacterized HhH-GPD family protein
MRAVQSSCDTWFVLSAKHGLLDPDEVIEPYDVALKDLSPAAQRAWSADVLVTLRDRLGDLCGRVFEIHAGSAYRDNGLVSGLKSAGATVEIPTEGLTIGQQLAFYARDARRPAVDDPTGALGRPTTGYGRIGEFLHACGEESVTLSFTSVEEALGRALPASARKYPPWWANTDRSPQGRGWLGYGWRVGRVQLESGVVWFDRRDGRASRVEGATSPPVGSVGLTGDAVPGLLGEVQLEQVRSVAAFTYTWPTVTEAFDRGWEATVIAAGVRHLFRHGLGGRVVFGSSRPHSVTFLDGQPAVEATAEDAYAQSHKLVSLIKGSDRHDIRELTDLPFGYDGFEIIRQTDAIDAPYVRSSLVVRLAEDDLVGWARHALLRTTLRQTGTSATSDAPRAERRGQPDPPIALERHPVDASAVVAPMLAYGARLAELSVGEPPKFTPNGEANLFLIRNPLAFLLAVICDQGITAERAWAIPWDLQQRLGHLDPNRLANDAERVRAAFHQRPMLHRLVNVMPTWVCEAARRVVRDYQGDATRIWGDTPSAIVLQARLCAFKGISQKKAAMAVEILERDLGVPISDLAGSDVAYDIHVRRVFLRTGLADADDVGQMVANARLLNPDRPGSLDLPAWDIGRRWCRPVGPRCGDCVLSVVCPRLIDRGDGVRGM